MTRKWNATDLSKTSQNELLLCIKEYIQQEFLNYQMDGPFLAYMLMKQLMFSARNNLALLPFMWKIVNLAKDFYNLFHVKISKENLYVIIQLVKALQD